MELTSLVSRVSEDLNIFVPMIVVIGDKNSGKAGLIASIAGLDVGAKHTNHASLPIVWKFKHHKNPQTKMKLEYNGKCFAITNNNNIYQSIQSVTKMHRAGKDGEISVVVEKKGVPELIIIDLPEIDVSTKQNEDLMLKYMKPKESIILNVISFKSPSSTCESTRVTERADPTGLRTVLVISCTNTTGSLNEEVSTKGSKNVGHFYVRQRLINETCDQAKLKETELFTTNAELSQIDKSVVGIDLLVRKIVKMHTIIVYKWFPEVLRIIDDRIKGSVSELEKKPVNLMGKMGFMGYVNSTMDALRKKFIKPDSDECSTDISIILSDLLEQLHDKFKFSDDFLNEEIKVMKETTDGIRSGKKSVFHCLIEINVARFNDALEMFIENLSSHLDREAKDIILDKFKGYPELNTLVNKVASRMISKMKLEYGKKINMKIECEKKSFFTTDPEYVVLWNKLVANQAEFLSAMRNRSKSMAIEGHGRFKVKHLFDTPDAIRIEAFGLKMKMTAYINVVIKRVVEFAAVHLRFMIDNLVIGEMHTEILNTILLCDDNTDNLLQISPEVAAERDALEKKIALLLENKSVVTKAMDTIPRH